MSSTDNSFHLKQYNIENILLRLLQNTYRTYTEKPRSKSSFYRLCPTAISLSAYINRLSQFLTLSNEHFLVALKYFERIIRRNHYRKFKLSLHKLFFLCLMAADKYLEDDVYSNAYYAQVAGIKCGDLFEMEIEFYESIGFELYIDDQELEYFRKELYKKEMINLDNSIGLHEDVRVEELNYA